MRVYQTGSEQETIALGVRLAKQLPLRAVVLLIGPLGAGKTTLAKGLVEGLGAADPDEVSSPTFTLVHEYGVGPKVYHVDLYRIERPAELETLGIEDLMDADAIMLVEWGERFPALWPQDRVEIEIVPGDGDRREIRVRSAG